MTRQELEERLLDYLYDELDERDRAAFEQALARHPEVEREVAAHRETRRAYAALPREAAPAGLLDGVLVEAEREAATRGKAAPVAAKVEAGGPSFWEKARRLLFQPTFAMAMVVLVVAGVSLVATHKGELPGMGPSSDAQRLPPVAVNQDTPRAMEPSAGVAAVTATLAAAEPVAPAGAASTIESGAAQATKEDAPKAEETGRGAVADGLEPSTDKKLVAPASDPVAFGARSKSGESGAAEPAAVWGMTSGSGGKLADDSTDAAPKDLAKGGDAAGDLDLALEDQVRTGSSDAPARRDSKAGEGAPVEAPPPPAKPTTEVADEESAPDSGSTDKERKEKAAPPESRNAKPQPTKGPPSETETPDVPAAAPKREAAEADRVTTTEVARSPAPTPDIDDERKAEPTKAPALTPPSSPEQAARLWTTYQQQVAAGAWADAQRSIEALAKLEGESARVKQARADLKKRMAESGGKASPAADKIPPDPPVQPPK